MEIQLSWLWRSSYHGYGDPVIMVMEIQLSWLWRSSYHGYGDPVSMVMWSDFNKAVVFLILWFSTPPTLNNGIPKKKNSLVIIFLFPLPIFHPLYFFLK